MEIAHRQQGDVAIVALSGRLDAVAAPVAEAGLTSALAGSAPRLAIDLSGLDYISSAGLRALLVTANKVQQANGKLALCGLSAHVREVFAVSGFDTLFRIADDAAAAVAAVG